MRRNISANIVSIGSMRIAEVREEDKVVMVVEQEDGVESRVIVERTLPSF